MPVCFLRLLAHLGGVVLTVVCVSSLQCGQLPTVGVAAISQHGPSNSWSLCFQGRASVAADQLVGCAAGGPVTRSAGCLPLLPPWQCCLVAMTAWRQGRCPIRYPEAPFPQLVLCFVLCSVVCFVQVSLALAHSFFTVGKHVCSGFYCARQVLVSR
jgi:hypothetical protein